MKQIIFATLILIVITGTSCSDDREEDTALEKGESLMVNLLFGEEQFAGLRAFSDFSTVAEPWEKEVNTLTVCVYNPNSDRFFKWDFTRDEILTRNFTFPIPASIAFPGDECEFYVIANHPVTAKSKEELLAMPESYLVDYNGTFQEVTTQAKRPGGFVMTANAIQTIKQNGTATPVELTLRRTVAKLAVEVSFSDDFAQKYPGALLRVTMGRFYDGTYGSWIFPHDTYIPNYYNSLWNQEPNQVSGKWQNLFYLYEGESNANRPLNLQLDHYIDLDGNYSTSYDRFTKGFSFKLEGSGNGKIERNHYYLVQVTIAGLSDWEVGISVSTSNWEVPFTENFVIDEEN